MRRVVVSADRIEVVEAPVPEPGPREALVRSLVTGICGSDTHAAHGRHPFIPLPYHPGHEVVGVVEDGGARVVVDPIIGCVVRGLEPCRNDRYKGSVDALGHEFHRALLEREEGVVLAHADVVARVELGAALAHEDVAGGDGFATELLHAETAAG